MTFRLYMIPLYEKITNVGFYNIAEEDTTLYNYKCIFLKSRWTNISKQRTIVNSFQTISISY